MISPRGALNLPAARFLQTKRFDPLPSPSLRDRDMGVHGRLCHALGPGKASSAAPVAFGEVPPLAFFRRDDQTLDVMPVCESELKIMACRSDTVLR